jgi:LysR family transcriptional regulator for bpeEF and oprC
MHFPAARAAPSTGFRQDGEVVRVPMAGPIAVNDADASVDCALQGLGLAQAAMYQARIPRQRRAGGRAARLPAHAHAHVPADAARPLAAPKLQAFTGWITALLATRPDVQLPPRQI